MPSSQTSAITPAQFTTFGDLLKFLRRRAGLSQSELSIGVGYSVSQISRLEKNQRAPDAAAIAARFVSELDLEKEPLWVARLLELAAASHIEVETDNDITGGTEPPTPRHNLPVQFTTFIGREKEIAEITRLLTANTSAANDVRLLTLTGAGGSGKTRLAICAARELLDEFPDGVFFVNLAPLTEAVLVIPTIAQILGVTALPRQTALEALNEHLRAKRLLLLLDNFEQVLDAAPNLVELLVQAPSLRILVTSRVVLRVSGEREFRVPPMLLPNLQVASTEGLEQNEAVALFAQRAHEVRQDFQLTKTIAPVVAEICVRLDGLPLAIELAAARTRILSPEELLTRLSRRLALLTGGARDLPARQQTLRNTIDWSYQLLKPDEQKLFRRLGIFVGGWILDAAEKVCNTTGDIPGDLIDGLQTLSDHNLIRLVPSNEGAARVQTLSDQNLIRQMPSNKGAARFGMLETLREYALEQLEKSGERATLEKQHAEYYLALVEAALPKNTFPDIEDELVVRIDEEKDNLRAALAWSQRTSGNAQMGLRIAEMSETISNRTEEASLLERVLANADAQGEYDTHTRARVLFRLGGAKAFKGDLASAELDLAASHALFQELGDQMWTASTLERLGWVARERGETGIARLRLEQALAIARGSNDDFFLFTVGNTLGETMTLHGDFVSAQRLLEEMQSLERGTLERGSTHWWSLGWTLNHLGHIAQINGQYDRATRLYEESLSLFQKTVGPWGIIESQHCLGETALAQGNAPVATVQLREALALAQEADLRSGVAWCLAGLAGVAVLNEEPERAAFLWGAAEQLRQRLGVREGPATHDVHQRLMAQAREQLGEQAFAAAWAKGAATPLEEVMLIFA